MLETFVYLTRPTKANFLQTLTESEKLTLSVHFEYLNSALKSQTLIMAGPCTDAAFGIVVFKSASLNEAEKFMNNDPAIKAGIFSGELHPYRVSLIQDKN
jgi:uncharacterized protein